MLGKTFLTKCGAWTLTLSLIFSSGAMVFAQEESGSKLNSDAEMLENILSKVDIDYGYQLSKDVSLMSSGDLGFRTAGSEGELESANYIEKAMKDLGLSNVRKDEFPVDSWNFEGASLGITSAQGEKKNFTLSSYAGSVGTDETGITGEIVYVGDGTLANYEGKDVNGKIVYAEFDMNNDFWVTQPSYQAELKGAKALIVSYTGDSYGVKGDALNSFDVISRDVIPIMNMSRNDGKELKALLEKGSVEGNLISKVTLNKTDGKSSNVIGEIPGKMKDKYIMLGAHYDGYFNAFQDDIVGVGIFMTVAKAILASGYTPEHTLIFVAHGAEEYGVTNSHYDWITGSWNQINKNTPQWSENTMMFLNFDTQRPDMKDFVINVTPAYKQFFEKYSLTMNLPEPWVNGVFVKGTNGPWSDDYNYISEGIPGLITGKGTTQWKMENYHTNYDDYTIYNPVTFKFNVENYVKMTLAFDKLLIAPLNFTGFIDEAMGALDSDLSKSVGLSDEALIASANQLKQSAQKTYVDTQKANMLYGKLNQLEKAGAISDIAAWEALKKNMLENRSIGLKTYKLLESEFTKLDSFDVVTYGHKIAQLNLAAVLEAKNALESKNGESALKAITKAESGWAIPRFEKEVYEYWGMEAMDPTRTDLYWGTGRTLPVIDLYDVYYDIEGKIKDNNTDFMQEIKVMDEKVAQATKALSTVLANETNILAKSNDMMKGYTLDQLIADGTALMNASLAKLPASDTYADVTSQDWAYEAIMGMALEGVIEPDGGTFGQKDKATRAEIAKWLTLAFDLPTDVEKPQFSDVAMDSQDMNYIAAVVKAGMMKGNDVGGFMPDASITKAEMATIGCNLLGLKTLLENSSAFKDVAMDQWYAGNVQSAAIAGLILGNESREFEPEKAISKAESLVVLERLMYTK